MKNQGIINPLVFTVLFICTGLFPACGKNIPAQAEFALGTVCTVNLYEYGNQKIYNQIFQRIREIDTSMSARQENSGNHISSLMLINQNAGIKPVNIEADLIEVLEKAIYYAEISNGAFDPTIGPLVSLWGIGTENEKIPNSSEIAKALLLVDWKNLVIDHVAGTAFLLRPGMALDLGGIAKGYAADEAVRITKEAGITHAIIDLGGNIAAHGSRDSKNNAKTPWRIGVQDPLGERGEYIGVLSLTNKNAVTSGVYERFFEADGKKYHHILSTEDGFPIDNGLLSVTIIADYSIDADGLSTCVFAIGFGRGMNLLEKIPNTEAIFIFDDLGVFATAGIKDVFRLSNDKYSMR